MNFFAKKGQIYCHDCGRLMVPCSDDKVNDWGLILTQCPVREHNRGSCWSTVQEDPYTEPVSEVKKEFHTSIGVFSVVLRGLSLQTGVVMHDVVFTDKAGHQWKRKGGGRHVAEKLAHRLAVEMNVFEL